MTWRTALEAYLRSMLTSADEVRLAAVRALPQGASNTTLAVDVHIECASCTFLLPCVLRLQRTSGLLAPYDVLREHRLLRILDRAGFPVPRPLWGAGRCDGLETPFFFMLRVEGRSLPAFWYPSQCPELQLIASQLAAIHSADWRRLGLDFLDEGGGIDPLEAELDQWRRRAIVRNVDGHPLLLALADVLRRQQPRDGRVALLHGDPNPGNFLLHDGRVSAVLDWELASLGDPRSDLGFYAALQTMFLAPPPVPGVTSLSLAYEAVTGTPLRDLAYYEALGLYKLAIVMAGSGGWTGFFTARERIERRLYELLGPRWAA